MKYLVIVNESIHFRVASKKGCLEKGSCFITDLQTRIIQINASPKRSKKKDILFLMKKEDIRSGWTITKSEFLELLKNKKIFVLKMEEK